MRYKNVVWDWNGTLLNDLSVGVNCLNDMLGRRRLPLLTEEEYKEHFGFPVVDFYHHVGFDLGTETMHDLSVDFVKTYDTYASGMKLNENVPEVLEVIEKNGVRQYILSALREDLLQQMIRDFNIAGRFDRACGSDNIYAAGKIERGQRMLLDLEISPGETVMVGDTVHDAEVAKALGFDCILFAGGHNSERRLREKAPVIHDLKELLDIENRD